MLTSFFKRKSLYFIAINFLLIISAVSTVFANSNSKLESNLTIDIYGTNQLSVDEIKSRYQQEFDEIISVTTNGLNSSENKKIYHDMIKKITEGLNPQGRFLYFKISPIFYPEDRQVNITIDVVEKKDRHRLSYFLPRPDQLLADPDHLIASWLEYDKATEKLIFIDKKNPKYKICPAYHCTIGFDDPALKKYAKIFNSKVEKNKIKLINILKNDKNAEHRGAAAFLLAHMKNSDELITALTPSIYDSDSGVRNNVMRVIGMTLLTHQYKNFQVEKVFNALDFPSETDRNKAIFIILALVQHAEYVKSVAKFAGNNLIKELKLEQRNLHGMSYEILKTISNKNYSDRDYVSWKLWLKNYNAINSPS